MFTQEFAALRAAAEMFKQELYKFQTVYDPSTVGIDEFCMHIDTVLVDIQADLYAEEEEE